MILLDATHRRLRQQGLIGPRFRTVEEAMAALTGVQAQDFPGAKWALAQRIRGTTTDAALTAAFNAGRILRTHLLRPTWHFVLPADLRWLQRLTAPRVHVLNAYACRRFEIDAPLLRRAHAALARALRGHTHLTRHEISAAFAAARIHATGTRLAYLIMHAELEALICSGPLRGKHHTYALVDERIPNTAVVVNAAAFDRESALAELTRRYFTGHGPALAADFAKWSSLTRAEIKTGLALAAPHLESRIIDGRTYWFAPTRERATVRPPLLHLLPNYDEFLGYRDHSATATPAVLHQLRLGVPAAHPHFIVRDGLVIGGWSRALTAKGATLTVRLLAPLSRPERSALRAAADRYAKFLGVPVTLAE